LRNLALISLFVVGGAALVGSARGGFSRLPSFGEPRSVFDYVDLNPVRRVASAVTAPASISAPRISRPMSNRDIVKVRLDVARSYVDRPLVVTSFVRTLAENVKAGGAPGSRHLTGEAVDISTAGHSRGELFNALKSAGFSGFGFYENHIHADIGPARTWFSSARARQLWA